MAIALYFIYSQLRDSDFAGFWNAITNIGSLNGFGILLSVTVLQFLNYSLEMLKWKETLATDKEVSNKQLLKAVYVGTSFAFVTPNRFGGFIGRFLVVTQIDKLKVTLSTFYGNFIQMIVTMLAGCIALLLWNSNHTVEIPEWMLNVGFKISIVSITIVFVWMIFKMKIWVRWIERLNWKFLLERKDNWTFIGEYSSITSLKMLFWGVLRYLTFCIQLYLLFGLFNIQIPIIDFYIFIGVLYLFTTFIPSAIASNVGTREAVALFLLKGLEVDAQIVISTLFLWLINMVLPALIGWIFLLKVEPIKEHN